MSLNKKKMKFEPFQALKFPNNEKEVLIYLEAKKMELILELYLHGNFQLS